MSNSENIDDLLKAVKKNKLRSRKTKPQKIVVKEEVIKPIVNEIKEEIKPEMSIAMKTNKKNKNNHKNKTIQKKSNILFDYKNTTVEI